MDGYGPEMFFWQMSLDQNIVELSGNDLTIGFRRDTPSCQTQYWPFIMKVMSAGFPKFITTAQCQWGFGLMQIQSYRGEGRAHLLHDSVPFFLRNYTVKIAEVADHQTVRERHAAIGDVFADYATAT